MSFIDCILLTLINAVACLAFPKLLSMILAVNTKESIPAPVPVTATESNTEVSSFSELSELPL
ncbi:hypothetical protein H6G33_22410 [Calothrix sp. FACHB-1219]|uniref:hypothetical protein n=1 Tax=unclassified Calothrix TaxID=2619626 RepID=UPI0016884C71|nr:MULTISPECIES: hypothetical protein [unclassified Calothrix]MBD2200950.1 hypothetical protein [Calothrix sp. FACHB-168]MBD2219772.1 hypothetical protein [Calothrix sp. FACHB-1219]